MYTTKVIDLMTKDLITIGAKENVISASELMIEKNIGSVIVVEDNIPIGIITERDIVKQVIENCDELCNIPVGDIASKNLITINSDESVKNALIKMHDHRVKRLPVKNPNNNEIFGIITTQDIVAAFSTLEVK
jgi:CBS domain-containing protein